MKKRLFMLLMTALFVLTLSTAVFAADSFDMTTAITATVADLTDQFWAIIAIIVPAILVIVGGKLVITKGIGWFKSLTGKA